MTYYFHKSVPGPFDEVIAKVTAALKKEGFGVLTEIDVQKTMKEKKGVDFRPYRILGACNPDYALRALNSEEWIGLMLPCNVVVQERPDGGIEIAAVDPIASMAAVDNAELGQLAEQVRDKLRGVIDAV